MKGLATASQALTHMHTIHSTAKYFTNEVKSIKLKNPYKYGADFTFHGPETARVGEPVVFFGTAMPGLVEVYSANKLERKMFTKNAEYYLALFFSKPGIYDMYGINMGVESNHLYVKVE